MRAVSIFLALAMVMAGSLAFLPSGARAAVVPKLLITVEGGQGTNLIFSPATIVLPQVPIILNVTLLNNGTAGIGRHTFTINDNTGATRIDIEALLPGDRASVEFAVNSTNQIYFRGQLFQAEASNSGGIRFYCIPHVPGMAGNIIVGGVSAPQKPEIGVFLRAYWIGLIGLSAMLVWIGITYFIIKSSSRHLRDHHDHIRRGLT